MEVAWGVHIHRCKRKHNPTLIICTKCQSPLANTRILGDFRLPAKLRVKRHINTFRLLLQLLQKSNGGRWPIMCADQGHKPVTDVNNLTVDIDTSSQTHHKGITHALHEGLQGARWHRPRGPGPVESGQLAGGVRCPPISSLWAMETLLTLARRGLGRRPSGGMVTVVADRGGDRAL
jgi:hypothetical protein